ncbi:c-type cytochrome [Niabella ginsengisoli]|uniref:C-type cytochrome n=1 Tax=Niabella ginsengisoli TaxID=522298 RepID=A0ABS9SKY2_9BACT|nr:c-type cytochrome [Niabella ginsengisoli]MCH5598419.1 c-type cytochrome [Niabella ginsengisoli]MCH5599034.1 c-type cytochrome [Niabella ginsengisoli]
MKKILLSLSILSVIAACGGGETDKKSEGEGSASTSTSTTSESGDLSSNPVYQKGLELTGKYQCPTCHKIDEKLTGPAYREVANKYAGADDAKIAELSKKIIEGGSGVWGEIPMTPHPNVSEQEAKEMVQYILLLKK